MGCAACGVVNDPGRKFCKECGARLSHDLRVLRSDERPGRQVLR